MRRSATWIACSGRPLRRGLPFFLGLCLGCSLLLANSPARAGSICKAQTAQGEMTRSEADAVAAARSKITEHLDRAKDRSTELRLRCIRSHYDAYTKKVIAACQRGATDDEVLALTKTEFRDCF